MDEKTALEEIQFIRKIIEDTKRKVIYSGKDYIFWGILVIIGMMSMYLLHLNKVYFNYFWIWAVLIPIGWIFSLTARKKIMEKHPATFTGKIIGFVWLGAGVAMTIIGFIGPVLGTIQPMAISPIACAIAGSAFFVSGIIVEEKWIRNLSFGWWIGGIILFFVTTVESFLIMALLMLFFQTIPGIIMYRKYKKEFTPVS
jgi:hypothetical protein